MDAIRYWNPSWDGSDEQLDTLIQEALDGYAYEIHDIDDERIWFDFDFDMTIKKGKDESETDFRRRAFRESLQIFMEYNEDCKIKYEQRRDELVQDAWDSV